MMPDNSSQRHKKNVDIYQARTAANMADALSFLIRIALQAGMQNIAVGLVGVRKELQAISAQADRSGSKKHICPDHRDGSRLNRPN